VDNHVLSLRGKLEENPSEPRHLITVHGVGYKFVP
jgi:DNA-binding response OmpR family regulator